MSRVLAVAGLGAVGGLAAHALPATLFLPPLRLWLRPQLAGLGAPGHIALTFDDGPHSVATAQVMAVLDRYRVKATFFMLGHEVLRMPSVCREVAARGHEIGVHGWDHRCLVWASPSRTVAELTRARDTVAEVTGVRPRWFRPAYGVLTSSALLVSRRLALTPVLWTSWGYDWARRATPASVLATVTKDLRSGGTVLLHDSDIAACHESWKATVGALPRLLEHCLSQGWRLGPLREHGVVPSPPDRAIPALRVN